MDQCSFAVREARTNQPTRDRDRSVSNGFHFSLLEQPQNEKKKKKKKSEDGRGTTPKFSVQGKIPSCPEFCV
jgi:hypothetical protein